MQLKIGNTIVGDDKLVLLVAELSANHLHNFELAVKTIKAMRESGADAVKLQTFTPDSITLDCDNKYFQIHQGTLWDGKNLHELYKETYTPWEWQPKLKELADSLGLIFFSTPQDRSAVDFLEKLSVPCYKVASFEIVDISLIEYIASKGKPVIISTGIAELADMEEAVDACRRVGNQQIALLKCTSVYPTPLEEVNLKTIPDLEKRLSVVIGLSDHTLSTSVPVAAVTLGAKIIEKHFILDRKLGGPDAAFSLEPEEFKTMAKAIRDTEKALGRVEYELSAKAKISREFARSLFSVKDIQKDELLTEQNIKSIRPGYGLPPKYLNKILGKKAKRAIKRGTPLSWEMIGK